MGAPQKAGTVPRAILPRAMLYVHANTGLRVACCYACTCSSPIRDKSQIITRLSAPHDERIVSFLGLQPTCAAESMQQHVHVRLLT